MNEQIKELAKNLRAHAYDMCLSLTEDCERVAAFIVDTLGYRKQSEGEWKAGRKNGQYGYYCTNCEAGFTGENAEWIAKSHDYCPNCGAIMKGGE